MTWSRPPPRIVIAGGSVAGLSLALILQAIGHTDWVVLEAQQGIAPQLGAGFVCNANGFRILDQLGLAPAMRATTEFPLEKASTWLPDGSLYGFEPAISSLFTLCVGYPMLVMDRQQMLQILYNALSPESKAKVIMGARLESVEESGESGVRVRTADGRMWSGDILIGADGVHSVARKEMWRLGRAQQSGLFGDHEEVRIRCSWRTTFGIAQLPPDKLKPGSVHVTHGFNKSCGYMCVGGGRTYFMLNEALPHQVSGADIPRYSDEDMDAMVKRRWNDTMQAGLTIGDMYSHKVRSSLVPMAEYVLGRWHYGRILCLGDSAHKLHHITGQGGNMCLEDVVAFVNTLTAALSDGHTLPLSGAQITDVFAKTQAARQARIETSTTESFLAQKLHALSTPFFRFLALRVLPSVGFDFTLARFVSMARAAPALHALEVPHRPMLVGFDDENPEPCGWGKRVVQWGALGVLGAASVWATVFGRSQEPSKGGALLTIHAAVIMALVLAEGWRRSNKLVLLQWPILWALLADVVGVQVAVPVCLFVTYWLISSRGRMTYTGLHQPIILSAARTFAPVVALALVLPAAVAFFLPSASHVATSSVSSDSFWQLSDTRFLATATSIFVFVCSFFARPRDIFDTRYIGPVQAGYGALAILMTVIHGATLPWLCTHSASVSVVSVLGASTIVTLAAMAVFAVAMVCDVCQYLGRTGAQVWAHALAAVVGCVVLGPGGTVMAVWFWRESAMARKMVGVLARVRKDYGVGAEEEDGDGEEM